MVLDICRIILSMADINIFDILNTASCNYLETP